MEKSLLNQEKGKDQHKSIPDSVTDPKMGTGHIKRCIIVRSSNYGMQMAMETASVVQ